LIVDADHLEAFLATRFGSADHAVAHLATGAWSVAFSFRRGGRDYVIRFGAHREDSAKDRLGARYAPRALPIPRVVELGKAFGGYSAISERVFGVYIDDVNETQMRVLLPSLFAAIDAARLSDISGTSGYGLWDADGRAPHPSWRVALLEVAHDCPAAHSAGCAVRHGARQMPAPERLGDGKAVRIRSGRRVAQPGLLRTT
jgi:hygromycin-B 4-O-kinase